MENELKAYVDQIQPLNNHDWSALVSLFSEAQLGKGDYFAMEGKREMNFAFLTKGIVRAYYQNSEGHEYNKAFFEPGEFFGAFTAMVTATPSYINIQALTDCTFLKADHREFESLFDQHPKIERLARRLAELFYAHKEKREIEMVLLDAGTRYQQFRKEYPNLDNIIPQFHIASYLGVTPTQLSRIRAKLPLPK